MLLLDMSDPPFWQVAVAEQDFATARALLAAGRDMIAVVDRDSAQLSAQVGAPLLQAACFAPCTFITTCLTPCVCVPA